MFLKNGNLILNEIAKYDNESILVIDLEKTAATIASNFMIDTHLELSTDTLQPYTYIKDIPTRRLPSTMTIGATKPSYPFAAVDYHIGIKGNSMLLQYLPIMNQPNVQMFNDSVVLTITLNYANINLPDEKIEEVKQQYHAWLKEANRQISSIISSVEKYNKSLKSNILSRLMQIKSKQERIKQQSGKLLPN